MIQIRPYAACDSALWNAFIAQSKNGTFLFNRAFMDYHAHRFIDHSLLFFEKNNLIAVLPLTQHQQTLISHGGLTYGGLVVSYKIGQKKVLECFEVLWDYLKQHHFEKLIYKKIPFIYTSQPCDEDLYALWKMGANVMKKEASSAIFLQERLPFSELRRRRRRRSENLGVLMAKSDDFVAFHGILSEVLKKHQAKPVHSPEEMMLLKSRFPENIELFVALENQQMIAGTLLFIYPQLIHTQYLAANDSARKNGALDFLLCSLIEHYQNQKIYFDFGISTENNGQFLNEGLIHHKEGFGAHTVAYETWEWLI